MKRFGVSLEDDLLKALDGLVKKQRLPNRSQAIRFLIRKNLVEEQWKENKEVSACIVLVYDHHKRDLLNKSTSVQHKNQQLILSTQHIHLDHNNCLKGVKHGGLIMSSIG